MPLALGWQLAIGAALSIFGGILSRRRAKKEKPVGTSRSARQITTEVVPERYIAGRARVSPIIVDAYTTSSFNAAERKTNVGTDLHLVGVLSTGSCERIERMWIDSEGKKEEVPLVRVADPNGDVLFPTASSGWQGSLIIREYFKANGTQGIALQRSTSNAFGPNKRFTGLSWVSIQIQQGYENEDTGRKNGRIFTRIPTFEFLVKGIKIRGLADDSLAWTESAAPWFYWLLKEKMNVPDVNIDRDSFVAAETVCSTQLNPAVREGYVRDDDDPRIRYSINGVIHGDDAVDDVIENWNWNWQGACPIVKGEYKALPGTLRPASFSISDEDIKEGSLQAIRISSPIEYRVNRMVSSIPQSSTHSWTPLSLKYDDSSLQTRDGEIYTQDVGDVPYCVHPYEGGRLMAIASRLLQGRAYRFRLVNNPSKLSTIEVGEQGLFSLRVEGITTPIHGIIDSASLTGEHTTEVVFREIIDGAYADTLVHPPEVPSIVTHEIVKVFRYGGENPFSGYGDNVSRWRWGPGDRTMLMADSSILSVDADRLNSEVGNTTVWPFGITSENFHWYRTREESLQSGSFNFVKVDTSWKGPEDASSISTASPTKVDVKITTVGGDESWVESEAGSWVDLERRGIDRGNGIQAMIHFVSGRNVGLTDVTITLANTRQVASDSGDLSEEDEDYKDSLDV